MVQRSLVLLSFRNRQGTVWKSGYQLAVRILTKCFLSSTYTSVELINTFDTRPSYILRLTVLINEIVVLVWKFSNAKITHNETKRCKDKGLCLNTWFCTKNKYSLRPSVLTVGKNSPPPLPGKYFVKGHLDIGMIEVLPAD